MDLNWLVDCKRCNGSGTVARSTSFPCSYIGAGPVPDYATGVYESECDGCRGRGQVPQDSFYADNARDEG